MPEGYRSISPASLIALCALLPAIYGIAVGFRIFVQRHRISIFEIAQLAASFGLAAFGVVRASHNAAAPALGLPFLLLAGICYWGTLSRFAADSYTRNRRVSATWAAALLVAGGFLLLPGTFQIPFLCAAALLTAVLYTRTGQLEPRAPRIFLSGRRSRGIFAAPLRLELFSRNCPRLSRLASLDSRIICRPLLCAGVTQ